MEIERKWMVNGWPEGGNLPALPLKEEFAKTEQPGFIVNIKNAVHGEILPIAEYH